jgi:oxepin-CoA hydrolase/3-oxo-5,6-dehydrosuberyl-CoA semialdehyde dehydrogenase
MKTLRSYVVGGWHEATAGFTTLVNPSTEEPVARASSQGVDFAAVLAHARDVGGPVLRAMTFAERGELLKKMSKALRDKRDELMEISRVNAGTTAADGAFDIDGATGALHYYSTVARALGNEPIVAEGEGTQLGRSEAFWVQHVLVPRHGVAVHVNAFNFPAWGFAEKAACALLGGMPVITKPATATSLLTERCVEVLAEAGVLPPGALQLVCGGLGDLLDRLGPQDVFAFTGSASTARGLRAKENLTSTNTRVNVEADSLNAAVLGPDAGDGPTFDLFVRDVVREITHKAGQKCTAVRRVFAPAGTIDRVQDALVERLGRVVTGNPAQEGVTMGPLATAQQLEDALDGVRRLQGNARLVAGSGKRADGVGSPSGRGYFLAPTLLRADDAHSAAVVHEHEVFAPVATLLPYDGSASDAAGLVGRGGGMLVTSVYSDDLAWTRRFIDEGAATSGRLYIGSQGSASEAPGSGLAFPAALHGGPGRAGGGAELGGLVGVRLYMQRVALQGSRDLVEELAAKERKS